MTIICAGMGEPDFYNLIRNGSFVDHADGWYASAAPPILATYDAGESHAPGSGAMSLPDLARLIYVDEYQIRPLRQLTTYDVIVWGKSEDAGASVFLKIDFYSDAAGVQTITQRNYGTGALTGGTWHVGGASNVAIPVGATHYRIRLESGGATFADDLYFGPPGGAPPFPGRPGPMIGNRIVNGHFETDTIGWDKWDGAETMVRSTVAPLSGVASLSVTTPGGASGQGIWFAGQNPIVIPGETLRFSMLAEGSGNLRAAAIWDGADAGTFWTGDIPASVNTVSDEVVVPEGAIAVFVTILTTSDQAVTFTLDDITLEAV